MFFIEKIVTAEWGSDPFSLEYDHNRAQLHMLYYFISLALDSDFRPEPSVL